MIDERLSALLDGEAPSAEAERSLRGLQDDPEYRAAWQRQLWLREALQNDGEAPAYDPGFADRVGAALDAGEAGTDNVVSLARRRRPWRAPAAGLAAAASIAAAMVVVNNPLSSGSASEPAEPATVAAGGAVDTAGMQQTRQVAARGGNRQPRTNRRRTSDRWSVSNPAVADQLNGYLVEHNGLASRYGMSGARPDFVRVATYGREQGR